MLQRIWSLAGAGIADARRAQGHRLGKARTQVRSGVKGMPWKPGIQPPRRQRGLSDGLRTWHDCAMKTILVGAAAFGCVTGPSGARRKWKSSYNRAAAAALVAAPVPPPPPATPRPSLDLGRKGLAVVFAESGIRRWADGPVASTMMVTRIASLANDGSFDTGDLAPRATSTMVQMPEGGLNYHCSIHPTTMFGAIGGGGGESPPPCTIYCD